MTEEPLGVVLFAKMLAHQRKSAERVWQDWKQCPKVEGSERKKFWYATLDLDGMTAIIHGLAVGDIFLQMTCLF